MLSADQSRLARPNVVVIFADDLGYGDFGCYGGSDVATPNCDRLAREGMRFTDMHSTSAVCTPSRYSLLTGRYAWRTWLKDWVLNSRMPLLIEEGRETVQSLFQRHGYTTGCIGKWHLGWGRTNEAYQNGVMAPGPLQTGFDYYFGMPFSHNSRSPEMDVYVRNERVAGLEPDESIMDAAVQKRLRRSLPDTAAALSSEAISFLERNANKPFFLYYATAHVHSPLTPHERFKGRSRIGPYGDFVAEFDWAVGELMEALERLDLVDNTLLIVTSDNGSVRTESNQPWRGIKGEVYEGGHRVPFIARWPAVIEPGRVTNQLATGADLFRTWSEILETGVAETMGEDSFSMLSLLKGNAGSRPVRPHAILHSVMGVFSIRAGRWKLIDGVGGGRSHGGDSRSMPFQTSLHDEDAIVEFDPVTGRPLPFSFRPVLQKPSAGESALQLYDLHSDPGERVNLANSRPQKVRELGRLLVQTIQSGNSHSE